VDDDFVLEFLFGRENAEAKNIGVIIVEGFVDPEESNGDDNPVVNILRKPGRKSIDFIDLALWMLL